MRHGDACFGDELMHHPSGAPAQPDLQAIELKSGTDHAAHDAAFSCTYTHRLRFTRGVFAPDNDTLAKILFESGQDTSNVAVFVDAGYAGTRSCLSGQIKTYFERHLPHRTPTIHEVPGGEAVKNTQANFQRILDALHECRLCRKSFVIAVGGGAVLDAVGFAAAITHRGLRLVRVATTTLSQADSAMAVKNGINAYDQKNYMGVFTMPWAVINDEGTLDSLAEDHWLAGFSEVIKVALLKDPLLFEYLSSHGDRIRRRNLAVSIPAIRRSAKLHFDHITQNGDPFEREEARPLDFGHWSAHKLEQMSGFELSHGQAVAIGIAIDATYAQLMGWLSAADHQKILTCLHRMGFSLFHKAMQQAHTLLSGLDEFQEHLGGRLTIPSIRRIGDPFDLFEIDTNRMRAAISYLESIHNDHRTET